MRCFIVRSPHRIWRYGTYGAKGSTYRASVGKPEGKRSLGTPRRKWEDNIKIDLKEMGWKVVDWTDLSQKRDRRRAVVNRVIYFGFFIK